MGKHAAVDGRDENLRLLRIDQVLELMPIGKSTLYALVKRGEFPHPMKIGGTSFWSNVELGSWLAKTAARSRASRQSTDDDDVI